MVPTATEATEDSGRHIRSRERPRLGIELEKEMWETWDTGLGGTVREHVKGHRSEGLRAP